MENTEAANKCQEIAQEFAGRLIEHADAVLILASVTGEDPELTELCYAYKGSYHTVLGLMEHLKTLRLSEKVADCIASRFEV